MRLGVVSFLNARPLVCGLPRPGVQCTFDVPAALAALLERDQVDAALIPIVDFLRLEQDYTIVSDACIASDGETMTVRVFSQTPPDRLHALAADCDSHTSVALARVLWRKLYGRDLQITPFNARVEDPATREAVLLIGDKVVDPSRGSFAYEVDLGGAWRQLTNLPFVFALWVARPAALARRGIAASDVAVVLARARDGGIARAAEIAARDGPTLGWPLELANRYLTRCMRYVLDARTLEGARLFAHECAELGLTPPEAEYRVPPAES